MLCGGELWALKVTIIQIIDYITNSCCCNDKFPAEGRTPAYPIRPGVLILQTAGCRGGASSCRRQDIPQEVGYLPIL